MVGWIAESKEVSWGSQKKTIRGFLGFSKENI
jgi:hypothetical protein